MKSMLSAAALAASALFVSAPASAAVTFAFTPASSHINVGQAVQIEARISGLDDEILSSFDLNFLFNPAVLNWTLLEYFGAPLGNTVGLANNGLPNGNLGVDDASLDDDATLAANQANDFLLFRFSLVGMADGATTFTLGPDLDFDRNFVGRRFQSLDVTVGSACIAVGTGSCDITPVPEPAGFGLAALGLLAAGLAGRGRRRTAEQA